MGRRRIFDRDDPDLQAAVLDTMRSLSPDGIVGPTWIEWTEQKPEEMPGRDVVSQMFGGWRQALRVAGLISTRKAPEKYNKIRPTRDVDRELYEEIGWTPTDAWMLHRKEGDANLSEGLTAIERPGASYYDWQHHATVPGVISVKECGDRLTVTVRTVTVYELI